jgi:hypothetical protein
MEAAMGFLAETDLPYAEAKTQVLRSEIFAKRVRARVFLVEEGSVEVRKAKAEANNDVADVDEGLIEATLKYEELKARRQRAEILIDVWRSVNASQRKS